MNMGGCLNCKHYRVSPRTGNTCSYDGCFFEPRHPGFETFEERISDEIDRECPKIARNHSKYGPLDHPKYRWMSRRQKLERGF